MTHQEATIAVPIKDLYQMIDTDYNWLNRLDALFGDKLNEGGRDALLDRIKFLKDKRDELMEKL